MLGYKVVDMTKYEPLQSCCTSGRSPQLPEIDVSPASVSQSWKKVVVKAYCIFGGALGVSEDACHTI